MRSSGLFWAVAQSGERCQKHMACYILIQQCSRSRKNHITSKFELDSPQICERVSTGLALTRKRRALADERERLAMRNLSSAQFSALPSIQYNGLGNRGADVRPPANAVIVTTSHHVNVLHQT